MITRDNLMEVVSNILPKDLKRIASTDKEYAVINLNIFNTGCTVDVTLTNNMYGNKEVTRANKNGVLVIETSELIDLIEKQKSNNE